VRWHHDPEFEHPDQRLAALVAAGDHVANHLQRCEESAGYQPECNKGIAALNMLVDNRICDRFSDMAPNLLDDVLRSAAAETGNNTSSASTEGRTL